MKRNIVAEGWHDRKPAGAGEETAVSSSDTYQRLGVRSVRGAGAGLLSQVSRAAIQLGSTAVLARLLGPEDYGFLAMAGTLIGFVGLFVDPGVSWAVVQAQHLTRRQINTMFWTNAAIGVGLFGVCAGLGPILAWIYREPRLSAIAVALGAGLLVQALGVLPQALLRRTLSFATIAKIEVSSTAVGAVCGLAVAWCGAKYWALVVLMTAGAMCGTVLLWICSRWSPGRPRRADIRALVEFSSNMARFSISNYFARNGDNFLIGICWGAEPLGVYSRAYAVMVAPVLQGVNGLAAVAIPVLSRLRASSDRYRRYFCGALALVALVTIPVFLSLFLCSQEIVAILFGPGWEQVGPILRVLSLAALFQPILSTCGWNYICCANTRRLRRWGLWSSGVTVSFFLLGLPWGPLGVAIGYAVAVNLLMLPGCLLAIRDTPLVPRDILAAVKLPCGAGLVFLVSAAIARYAMIGQRPGVVLTGSVASGLLAVAVLVWRARELRARLAMIRSAVWCQATD